MNLKDILNEQIGGIVEIRPIGGLNTQNKAQLLQMAKEITQQEEDSSYMTKEDLAETISKFGSYGESIYKKHDLKAISETFLNIAKSANKVVVEETADWFDRVTVKRNMSDLGKQANQFHKIATEAQSLNDRMSSLYEDMGQILNRYFTINDVKKKGVKEGKNYRQHENSLSDAHYNMDEWMPEDPDLMDEYYEILNMSNKGKRLADMTDFIENESYDGPLMKYLGNKSIKDLAKYIIKKEG